MKRETIAVYIMANKNNGTLYIGVTSNLIRRVYEHKNIFAPSFTQKYNCKMLVYYEIYFAMKAAIFREKQLKNWSRIKKIKLIESINPTWKDLYSDVTG